jgi:RNA polymerase sigma-70 factor (ECF subfamily)
VSVAEDRLKALMLRGLDGDAAAHQRLLGELALLLRGFYARRLGGDAAEAEDLVQETLIAVHTRRESYDPSKPFTAWAFAIARYRMIDAFRRRGTRSVVPIDEINDLFAADEHEAAAARLDLGRLLRDLPARQRNAILQVKIHGLSIEEAARSSGLSESNVKISIHRGLNKLMARIRGSEHDADR